MILEMNIQNVTMFLCNNVSYVMMFLLTVFMKERKIERKRKVHLRFRAHKLIRLHIGFSRQSLFGVIPNPIIIALAFV